jgi:hypothetical protein
MSDLFTSLYRTGIRRRGLSRRLFFNLAHHIRLH